MDSSCIQDKCHARASRSIGRVSTTLMISKGADVPVFHEAETRKKLSKTTSVLTFPIFNLAQHFKLPEMPTWRCIAGSLWCFLRVSRGSGLALLMVCNSHSQGLNHQFHPMSLAWLVAAPCFNNHQRDGKVTFRKPSEDVVLPYEFGD